MPEPDLWSWLETQRHARNTNPMPAERVAALAALPDRMPSPQGNAYDVFVGHPATVEQVQRTIEYTLNSSPVDRGPGPANGWAVLGP